MYARIVRFTGVTRDQVEAIKARVEANDGPPEGVPSTGLRLFFDEEQGTGVFVGFFATMDDLRTGEAVLEQMDTGDTFGTRETVDRCEVVIERDA